MYESRHRWRDLIKHLRSKERSGAQHSAASCIAQCRPKRTGHARGARITQGLDATNNGHEEAALIQSKFPHAHREVPARTAQPWMALGLAQACACFTGRAAKGYTSPLIVVAYAVIVSQNGTKHEFKCCRWAVRVHMMYWVSSRTTLVLQNYFLRSYVLTTSVLIMKQFIHPFACSVEMAIHE